MNLVQRTRWHLKGLEGLDYQHSYLVTEQPPELGRHHGVAIRAQSTDSPAEVLPQAGIDLGAGDWSGVVGVGLSVHEALHQGLLGEAPEKKGKDLETTRKTCAKFRANPVGIFNLPKALGLRRANMPSRSRRFATLLKPKAGGIAFVLDAMGEQLKSLVNVTIHYPGGRPGYGTCSAARCRTWWCSLKRCRFQPSSSAGIMSRMRSIGWRSRGWINQLWENQGCVAGAASHRIPKQAMDQPAGGGLPR